MAPTATALAKRTLPSKEASAFKELLSNYENRQLKKALKSAEQILKKFPEHGETTCMKGLILTNMNKKEEGLELVKKGVRLDLTSHICWHVLGLVQKADKKYEEALKSYSQALRFDKENMNILRDSAQLQAQLRHFDAMTDTRHLILQIRPNLRQNWVSLAVAYHLNGNLQEAVTVLEQYERTLKNVTDYDVEHSESLLYHIHLLDELGEYQKALSKLEDCARQRSIVDKTVIMERRARFLTKLQKTQEAEIAWRALLERNPEDRSYYSGLMECLGLSLSPVDDSARRKVLTVLDGLRDQYPRAHAPRRIALDITFNEELSQRLHNYLLTGLSRGVPSLHADIKGLYSNETQRPTVVIVVESIMDALTEDEPPTTRLWTLYFLAQHYSTTGDFARAQKILDEAIEHTPTLPELYMCQARVLKRAGDPYGAAESMDTARRVDEQDRYLNTKAGVYLLRAGLVEEASHLFGMFTKKDAASPGADLEEMQSLLFLSEEGATYLRAKNWPLALKRFNSVIKMFEDVQDDEFDFHSYAMRRFTLDTYISLVAWENRLKAQPSYVKAALAVSKIYCRTHDDPSLVASTSALSSLPDAEKKAKKKAKKAAQKQQQADTKKNSTSHDEDAAEKPKDDDPAGTKALAAPDGLDRAWNLLNPLLILIPDNLELWSAVFDLSVRRKKYLQALRAHNHVKSLAPEHDEVYRMVAELSLIIPKVDQLPETSARLFDSVLLSKDSSLEHHNSQYLQQNSKSARAVLTCARVAKTIGQPKEEVESLVFTATGPECDITPNVAATALEFLDEIKSGRISEFRESCDKRFLLSTLFKSPKDIKKLQAKAIHREEVDEGNTNGKEELDLFT